MDEPPAPTLAKEIRDLVRERLLHQIYRDTWSRERTDSQNEAVQELSDALTSKGPIPLFVLQELSNLSSSCNQSPFGKFVAALHEKGFSLYDVVDPKDWDALQASKLETGQISAAIAKSIASQRRARL